jgi:hypothetical protein
MTGTNRTSTPTVPDNTATFTNSFVVALVQMRSIARAGMTLAPMANSTANAITRLIGAAIKSPPLFTDPHRQRQFSLLRRTLLGRDGASMQIISSVDSSLRVSIENKPDLWDFGHCDGVSTG